MCLNYSHLQKLEIGPDMINKSVNVRLHLTMTKLDVDDLKLSPSDQTIPGTAPKVYWPISWIIHPYRSLNYAII